MHIELLLITLLVIKHFIVDFPFQFKNKGTYGYLGGLLHAGLHALGTFIVFMVSLWLIVGPDFLEDVAAGVHLSLLMAAVDGVIHYLIDWVKSKLNKKFAPATTSRSFWCYETFGLDQLLHSLTYIGLIFYAVTNG